MKNDVYHDLGHRLRINDKRNRRCANADITVQQRSEAQKAALENLLMGRTVASHQEAAHLRDLESGKTMEHPEST